MTSTIRPGTIVRWNRLRFLLRNSIPDHGVIVDIGGFDGTIGKALLQGQQIRYYGLDIDKQGLNHLSDNGLSGVCASGEHLPFLRECVDLVLLLDVIEHVVDDERLLREAYQVVKPDGRLILTTPIAERKLVPWIDMHRVHQKWDHALREGYLYNEIAQLIGRSGFEIEYYTTSFNVISRWAYYFHFLAPVLSKLLVHFHGVFTSITRLEPFLQYNGLTHVFILRTGKAGERTNTFD